MFRSNSFRLVSIALCTTLLLLTTEKLTAQTPPEQSPPTERVAPPGEESGENGVPSPAEETAEKTPPEESGEESPAPVEEEQKKSSESVWTFLQKGGSTMFALALISTVIAGLVLERFFFFRRQKISTKGYYERVSAALDRGGLDELEKEIQGDTLLLSRVLQAGLRYRSEGIERVEKSIETIASVEIGKLERSLNFLNNLGNLAPLVGFFGTVTGMRHSFLQFVEKAAPTARDLAGGVEEALITTITGLMIAIPTYFVYNLFIYYIDTLTIELERCTSDILEKMK